MVTDDKAWVMLKRYLNGRRNFTLGSVVVASNTANMKRHWWKNIQLVLTHACSCSKSPAKTITGFLFNFIFFNTYKWFVLLSTTKCMKRCVLLENKKQIVPKLETGCGCTLFAFTWSFHNSPFWGVFKKISL